jgi:proline iminopeptidase
MFYALHHPERVKRLLLRGIFFGDAEGARYIIDEDGAAKNSRNKWFEDYCNHIPAQERKGGLTIPYYRRLTSPHGVEAIEAARLFHLWDFSIATKEPWPQQLEKVNAAPEASLPLSKIFFHYVVHEFKNAHKDLLLGGMKNIPIPVDIVHGRQDWITPVANALLLHETCKASRLAIIEDCGHSMLEPNLQKAFVAITDRWIKD